MQIAVKASGKSCWALSVQNPHVRTPRITLSRTITEPRFEFSPIEFPDRCAVTNRSVFIVPTAHSSLALMKSKREIKKINLFLPLIYEHFLFDCCYLLNNRTHQRRFSRESKRAGAIYAFCVFCFQFSCSRVLFSIASCLEFEQFSIEKLPIDRYH